MRFILKRGSQLWEDRWVYPSVISWYTTACLVRVKFMCACLYLSSDRGMVGASLIGMCRLSATCQ
jgi:hypothetical protein